MTRSFLVGGTAGHQVRHVALTMTQEVLRHAEVLGLFVRHPRTAGSEKGYFASSCGTSGRSDIRSKKRLTPSF